MEKNKDFVWRIKYSTSAEPTILYVAADTIQEAIKIFSEIYVGKEHFGYETDVEAIESIKQLGILY